MSDFHAFDSAGHAACSPSPIAALQPAEPCEECVGSGGWYRYEPALAPEPGLLYLSCLHCRGSGLRALVAA